MLQGGLRRPVDALPEFIDLGSVAVLELRYLSHGSSLGGFHVHLRPHYRVAVLVHLSGIHLLGVHRVAGLKDAGLIFLFGLHAFLERFVGVELGVHGGQSAVVLLAQFLVHPRRAGLHLCLALFQFTVFLGYQFILLPRGDFLGVLDPLDRLVMLGLVILQGVTFGEHLVALQTVLYHHVAFHRMEVATPLPHEGLDGILHRVVVFAFELLYRSQTLRTLLVQGETDILERLRHLARGLFYGADEPLDGVLLVYVGLA